MNLKYIKGDVTKPIGDDPKIVIQLVNDIGAYGAGVSGAIANRWPEVESQYRALFHKKRKVKRGWCQFIVVGTNFIVCNIFAQNGINGPSRKTEPPLAILATTAVKYGHEANRVDYTALETCLKEVGKYARSFKASIHSPKIGAGLAGGNWNKIEQLLINICKEFGVEVYVYEYRS